MSSPVEIDMTPEPIAIIGIGCRYPGAESPSAFWGLVSNGVDAVSEIPPERWDVNAFYDPDPQAPGKMNTRWGGFLKQVDQFDPHFFKIPAREAPHVDPQQRLLLEVAWEALEDAGQVAEKLAGSRTGVFVGIMSNDYGAMAMTNPECMNFYSLPGLSYCITANRLSYFFDFRGPSMAIDTACSSSLVAVHLACRSLWSGETTLALAGGVNVILSAEGTMWYTRAGLMAADGRCKTFDARADGLVRGEGAGVVVLKPLSKALADGDPVYAVIKGSAVNQDGRSNGMTAPSRWSQEAVIREAQRRAGVSPARVSYVELHGTGTSLGDPIEAVALGTILSGGGRAPGDFCSVGSVKTNIGHLEAAAGVAGLTKVALMLKHRALAPSLHFQKPNPHIPYESLPLRVQQTLAPWPDAGGEGIVAAVSSFGFGGTNAHVVLGEAPSPEASERGRGARGGGEGTDAGACLLAISAQTAEALRANVSAYRKFLSNGGASQPLADICHTAGARRTHHDQRLTAVGRSHEELVELLDRYLAGEAHPAVAVNQRPPGRRPKLAFVFSGQGPQWWGMGRQLLRDEPVFRRAVEACDELFRGNAGWSLLEELTAEESRSRVAETCVAQPSLFALQVGLAALWRSWGVEPDAVAGHSVGEVAAAHVAGVLSLDDAARVIFHRSRLMQRLTGRGKMAAVAVGREEAERLLEGYEDRLSVAAHNAPGSCVLSGEREALEEVLARLKEGGTHCQLLPVNYAFHSPQLLPLAGELVESLGGVEAGAAKLPVFSTLYGGGDDPAGGHPFDAAYWGRQMREPVRFADSVGAMLAAGFRTFVEVGPHPVLGGSMAECFRAGRGEGVALASLRRGEDERGSMLKTLGALHARGYSVEWDAVGAAGARCVSLPSYDWQRRRFWLKEQDERYRDTARRAPAAGDDARGEKNHPLLRGRRMSSAVQQGTHHWESTLDLRGLPYLKDHRVRGGVVLPAAAYVEMALAAAAELFGADSPGLEHVSFEKALTLEEDGARKVQLVVSDDEEGSVVFRLFTAPGDDARGAAWTRHARGRISREVEEAVASRRVPVEEVKRRCAEAVGGEEFYARMARRGLEYGEAFRGVERMWRRDGEALASLSWSGGGASQSEGYRLPPVVLDACLQVLAGALPDAAGADSEAGTFLPLGFGRLRVHGQPAGEAVTAYAVLNSAPDGGASLEGDVMLLGEAGEVLVEVRGFSLLRVRDEERGAAHESGAELYGIEWRPADAALDGGLVDAAARQDSAGKWLVLADEGGVGRETVAGLEAAGERCVVARRGEEYGRTAENEFSVNPARAEDFRRLLADGFGPGLEGCRGVLHMWGADASRRPETSRASLAAAQAIGCESALHLVQALEGRGWPGGAGLWLVTSGAQGVGQEGGPVSPGQAPLWGFGRTVSREYPSRRCTLIDLSPDDPAGCVRGLLRELLSGSGEEQVALRGGSRYVARLVRLRQGESDGARPRALADGKTYLITGGLGALGLRVAGWMVGRGARHLVLAGRSAMSEAAGAAVRAMREAGASVRVMAADISDEEQLRALLAEVRATMPPLGGVIHAAGVADDGLLRGLDRDRLARVLAPKVFGSWNLHTQTLEDGLDFFVLFSSVSSLLGNAGQASYAAGNAFLDALAHHRRARGLPALSINWGPWAGEGMAAGRDGEFTRAGIKSIAPEEGTEVFGRLLGRGAAQAGVLAVDWPKFLAAQGAGVPRLLEDFGGEAAPTTAARPAAPEPARPATPPHVTPQPQALPATALLARFDGAPAHDRRGILVTHLQEEVGRVLGLPAAHRPGLQQGFFDMGMDSLMIAELGRKLGENLGRDLPLSVIIDRANIDGLADYLAGDAPAPAPAAKPAAAFKHPGGADSQLETLELLSEDEALLRLLQKLQ